MSTILRRLACLGFVAVLAGCANVASVQRVGPGEVVVDQRVALQLDGAWNQLSHFAGVQATTWTQDGITLDLLQFFVGLKDGQVLAPTPSSQFRPLVFKASMQPDEVIALFQGLYTRNGSSFELGRVEPVEFLGGPGFRFEFSVARRLDDVRISGVAWATVRNAELYALTFTAPQAAFFARHRPRVEQVAQSARLKG